MKLHLFSSPNALIYFQLGAMYQYFMSRKNVL